MGIDDRIGEKMIKNILWNKNKNFENEECSFSKNNGGGYVILLFY